MRHIHSERFNKSHHIMEIHDLLQEANKRLKFPLSFCTHCDTLQEKPTNGRCARCHRHVQDAPTDAGSMEAFLETILMGVLLMDYRWVNTNQMHLIVLNGRDV